MQFQRTHTHSLFIVSIGEYLVFSEEHHKTLVSRSFGDLWWHIECEYSWRWIKLFIFCSFCSSFFLRISWVQWKDLLCPLIPYAKQIQFIKFPFAIVLIQLINERKSNESELGCDKKVNSFQWKFNLLKAMH